MGREWAMQLSPNGKDLGNIGGQFNPGLILGF